MYCLDPLTIACRYWEFLPSMRKVLAGAGAASLVSLVFAGSAEAAALGAANSAKHSILVQAKQVFSFLPCPSQLATIFGASIHEEHASTQ
jgi:hypothetical protein